MTSNFICNTNYDQYCDLHPMKACSALLIDPTAIKHQVCENCVNDKQLSEKVVLIEEIFKEKSQSSPFMNKVILKKMKNYDDDIQQLCSKIESYYQKLESDLLSAIKARMSKDINRAIDELNECQEQVNQLEKVLSVQAFQDLLRSKKLNSKELIHDHIVTICSQSEKLKTNIEQNFQKIENLKSLFSLKNALKIKPTILNQINNIDMFYPQTEQVQWDLSIIDCIPINQPSGIEIQIDEGQLVITSSDEEYYQFCYLNKELDPLKKYKITVAFNHLNHAYEPGFIVQISGESSEEQELDMKSIIYSEDTNDNQTTRVYKGENISGAFLPLFGRKTLEIGFSQTYKYWVVATYPDYQNINALQNQDVIDEKRKYRIIFGVFGARNELTIIEVVEVQKLDLMW